MDWTIQPVNITKDYKVFTAVSTLQGLNIIYNVLPANKEYKLCGYKNVTTARWVPHKLLILTCIDQTYPYVTTFNYLCYIMEMSTNLVSSPI